MLNLVADLELLVKSKPCCSRSVLNKSVLLVIQTVHIHSPANNEVTVQLLVNTNIRSEYPWQQISAFRLVDVQKTL